MFITTHRKIFYTLSLILILSSILSTVVWGLKPGIDFVGGSLLSVYYQGDTPAPELLENVLEGGGFLNASVRKSGDDGYIIRTKEITQEEKNSLLKSFSFDGKFSPKEEEFSSVGPTLGKEAVYKSWVSIVLVLLAIVLFIAFAFRKVSVSSGKQANHLSSWVYGLVTVLALLHDVLIPIGVFSFLGHFYGFEVDTLFVTALLVILGFSVHDTIVVFDRIRENLHKNEEYKEGKDFEQIVGESINQTMIRSINTSFTTLLAVLTLYILGPETVKHFSLSLLIGITVGTYSSIFVGSPLLVTINNRRSK